MGEIATAAFIMALSDTDAEVRMWAATALGGDPNNTAYDALVAALQDPDAVVRAMVARAIGKLDRQEILAQLRELKHNEQDRAVQLLNDRTACTGEGCPSMLAAKQALAPDAAARPQDWCDVLI